MTTTYVITRAAEESGGGWNHWVVGSIALGILMFLLFALLAFGNGREHS